MFIKGVNLEKGEELKPKEIPAMKVKVTNKKWEPKKVDSPKVFELPNNVSQKLDEKISKVITINNKNHQGDLDILDKYHEKRSMVIDGPSNSSIDMNTMLSQITVKVPLSEMFRIE